jgi:type IV fimbrial biogenesis protein FimT
MNKWNLNTFLRGCRGNATPSLFKQFGFTLPELIISLGLLAIGAALSIPSYTDMVEKRQLTHGAEQIMAFVNSAQSEAVKRNRIVTVSFDRDANDDWCMGAVVGTTACNCRQTNTGASDYCAIDSAARIINNTHVGNTQLVNSMKGYDGRFSAFEPIRGLLTRLDQSVKVGMRSNSEEYQLDLIVSATGQVILCSADSGHSVPGYGVCP